MTHPNVGFKDAILEAPPGGPIRLLDPDTHRPLCPIEFHNRKAARNWANGRGMRVVGDTPSESPAFPRPLG